MPLTDWVAVLAGSAAFITALAAGFRWWNRKDGDGQPKAWPRRFQIVLDRALHTIVGRDAILDPDSGRVLKPAQPGMGDRMTKLEHAQIETTTALGQIAENNRKLTETAAEIAKTNAAIVRVHGRLDEHEDRIQQLEGGTAERIMSRAEAAQAYRVMAALAEQPPELTDE